MSTLPERLERNPDWAWYSAAVELYSAMIRTSTPFAQANYGDGEWACILGHDGGNVNGEEYAPELGDALAETLLDPVDQFFGWNPGRVAGEARAWCDERGIDVPWVYKDVLSGANVNGALGPFFRACRSRDVTIVGPEHLSDLGDEVVGPFRHVVVSDSRAWTEVDAIEKRLRWSSADLVLCAAGMGTNLIVHRLWSRRHHEKSLLGRPRTVLDIGACLDPYVGIYSRKSYRTGAFQDEAMARNLS